jgi:hypothetical protein
MMNPVPQAARARSLLHDVIALFAVFGPSACTAAEEPKAEPAAATEEVRAKFAGQAFAIFPFEESNSACMADPMTMDRTTFATCTHLDATKLPEKLDVTMNPLQFDPRPDRGMLLVVRAPGGWHAVLGLGPVPAEPATLLKSNGTGAIRPLIVPVLVAAAAPPLIEAMGTALLAAGVLFFGGRAVVATSELLTRNRAEPLVRGTERGVMMATSLEGMREGARQDATNRARNATDGGWLSAAACVDDGSTSRRPEWGYGATAEAAEGQAIDNAINMMSLPAQDRWDADTYCRILVTCQKVGNSVNCR